MLLFLFLFSLTLVCVCHLGGRTFFCVPLNVANCCMLDGAYDAGRATPVGLEGHVTCYSGR